MKGNCESLAKIARPRVRNVFKRERLFELLDESRRIPATYITSPPGSGKSTLVSSYLDEQDFRYIWYHVDANDLDVATFFFYMRMAMADIDAEGSKQLPLYTSAYKKGLPQFSLKYFERFYSLIEGPFVLVFDDMHIVDVGGEFNTVLVNAIEMLPPDGNIIMTSRKSPPADFSRLIANQSVCLLDWSNLRLNEAEVEGVVAQRNVDLSGQQFTDLCKRSDGWAAGLIIGLHKDHLDHQCGDPDCEHASEVLFDYFSNEVFTLYGDSARCALMKMAIMPLMTESMAVSLTKDKQAAELAHELYACNYFVSLQVLEEPTYSFHPLFRRFLLHELCKVMAPDDIDKLRIKAARILERGGFKEASINVYIKCKQWGSAVRLITADATNKFRQGRMQNLAIQINRLPREVVEQKPWLLYWLAMCQIFFEPLKAYEHFARAFRQFKEENNTGGSLASWAGVINALLVQWQDTSLIDEWIDEGRSLLAGSRAASAGFIGAQATSGMCFALHLCQPHSRELADYTDKTQWIMSTSEDVTFGLMGANLLVTFNAWHGDIGRSEQLLNDLRARLEVENCNDAQRLMWASVKGWHELTTGESQKCFVRCEHALELAEESGVHLFNEKFHGMAAHANLIMGKLPEAYKWLERYLRLISGKASLVKFHVHYLTAWYYWAIKDYETATAQLNIAIGYLHVGGSPPIVVAKSQLAEAILLAERDKLDDARIRLEEVRHTATLTNSQWLLYHVLMLEADWALRNEQYKECNRFLREGLSIARRQKLVVTDWWSANRMSELLQVALKNRIETDYVRRIIAITGLQPGPAARLSNDWPWPVAVKMLNGFELILDGVAAGEKIGNRRKVLELLKILAAHDDAGVSASWIADMLWPDAEGDDARNALKTTVRRLRALLDNKEAVLLREAKVLLNPQLCWSDVKAFRQLARTHYAEEERNANFKAALQLYEGELLPGDESAWVVAMRKDLRHLEHEVVMTLGELYESRHRWGKAVNVFSRGLEANLLDEQVCRHLMSCYQRLGQNSNALSAYERCRDQLHIRRARAPSDKTESLARSILHS